LGARFHGMEEVVGSNPTRSTNFNSLVQPLPGSRRVISFTYRWINSTFFCVLEGVHFLCF